MELNEKVKTNTEAYESLQAELENDHWGEWVILVDGQLAAIHSSLHEADKIAEEKFPNASWRLVRKVGEELPKVIQKY